MANCTCTRAARLHPRGGWDDLKQRPSISLSVRARGDNCIFFPPAKMSVTLNKLRVITSGSTGCLRQRLARAINITQTNEKSSFLLPSFYLNPVESSILLHVSFYSLFRFSRAFITFLHACLSIVNVKRCHTAAG